MFDMFDWQKLGNSEEMKRLLVSITKEVKAHVSNPDSGLGLAMNALMSQLSDSNSQVMNEANLPFAERQVLTRLASTFFKELRG